MRLLNRVLWREGMHLAQHHFQMQNRFVEDTIAVALAQLFPGAYGFTALELDSNAVRNGVAVITSGQGIMPDGLPFCMPDSDRLPAARDFSADFPPSKHSEVLHVALREHASQSANISGGAGVRSRYVSESKVVRDGVTGADEAAVDFALRDFRLLLDHEVQADDLTLPLARLARDGAGRFAFDSEFIPPCLKLSGSSRLCQIVSDVVARLEEKNQVLLSLRGAGASDLTEYAAHEIASFWMLHTVRSHLGPMRHHHVTREAHPERLYLDMARLAGELCTFTLDTTVREIPPYGHANPEECFAPLAALIGKNLEVVVQTTSERFAMVRDATNFFSVRVPNERSYQDAAWILAVTPAASDMSQISHVPQLVKVCARKFLPRLVQEGRAAIALHMLAAPPAAISPRPGTLYFGLQLTGPCWEAISRMKEVGAYVPDSFQDVRLELFVLASR